MKFSHTAPSWAVELVTEVCKDYHRAQPTQFQWYNVTSKSSSGYTRYNDGKVHISAGTDEWEHKIVLLHELAHHVLGKTKWGRKQHHSLEFWRLVFEMNKRYGDIKLAYKREIELATQWRPGTRVKAGVAYERALEQ